MTRVFHFPGAIVWVSSCPRFPLQRGQRTKNICANTTAIKGKKKTRGKIRIFHLAATNREPAKASQNRSPSQRFLRVLRLSISPIVTRNSPCNQKNRKESRLRKLGLLCSNKNLFTMKQNGCGMWAGLSFRSYLVTPRSASKSAVASMSHIA